MISKKKGLKGKVLGSYVSVIISISLVLFVLGLLGIILVNAHNLSNYVKENIGFSVILKENIKEVEIAEIQKTLDAEPFVKTTEFIHQDSAAAELKRELGEDFIQFLGYNPLLPSLEIKLNAQYANPDSLKVIESMLNENTKVQEVFYQKDLVAMVNENLKKIGLILIGFSVLLMIISFALINSSIRLSIYSSRFLIRTMQLVGATGAFIRSPFVARGITNGIISAFIAIGLLAGVLFMAEKEMPELMELQNLEIYISLFLMVIVLGILISWISTALAVRKYLRIRTSELYS
ncbi:MAG: cell division protein FtsX [Flavobacteriales bacterium]|nr:cell division protein FtsX [Flavobacteriales bacterium]